MASNILNSIWNISFPQALPTFYFDESEYGNALQKRGLILRWTKPIDRIKIVPSLSQGPVQRAPCLATVIKRVVGITKVETSSSWAWDTVLVSLSLPPVPPSFSHTIPARDWWRFILRGFILPPIKLLYHLETVVFIRYTEVGGRRRGGGDEGRWCLVHDYSTRSRLTFSNGCSILYIEGINSRNKLRKFISVCCFAKFFLCIFKIGKDCWAGYYR